MEKAKISKIPDYFKIESFRQDKRVIVFLICLFISTILWFLNALSKEYDTTIDYPVKYINTPKNQYLVNSPPEQISIKVKAYGFTLLRHKLHLTFTPIVLNINSLVSKLKPDKDLNYSIPTFGLTKNISNQISNEIDILEIQPEFINFVLDSIKTKKIPVSAKIEIQFKGQYDLTSALTIDPEVVEIAGPSAILRTIDTIYTEQKSFKDVNKNIETEFTLIEPGKTELKTKKVNVKITIEEFTEKIMSLPIQVTNKPDSINIKFFPNKVKVSFMVGLSKFSAITDNDFLFTVPYSDIEQGKPILTINLEKNPDFIKDLRYSPETFEYLIEKK